MSGQAAGPESAFAQLSELCARAASGEVPSHLSRYTGLGRVDEQSAVASAVVLLFSPLPHVRERNVRRLRPEQLEILFVERARSLSKHPGQIGFPGGVREPQDANLTATALRELTEETGIGAGGLDVLGTLSAAAIPITNFTVTPVVALSPTALSNFEFDPAETERVFTLPVRELLRAENRGSHVIRPRTITRGGQQLRIPEAPVPAPTFQAGERVIWGFTAMVLDHLFATLGWEREWDRNRALGA